jgi:ATP-dependent Clp protease ATP-binding subunit ClpC
MYPFERFSRTAKKALIVAQHEAERAHYSHIGTEHLLLGVLVAGGLGSAALVALGVEIAKVRAQIDSVLGQAERLVVQQIIPTARVKRAIEYAFDQARAMGDTMVGTEHRSRPSRPGCTRATIRTGGPSHGSARARSPL